MTAYKEVIQTNIVTMQPCSAFFSFNKIVIRTISVSEGTCKERQWASLMINKIYQLLLFKDNGEEIEPTSNKDAFSDLKLRKNKLRVDTILAGTNIVSTYTHQFCYRVNSNTSSQREKAEEASSFISSSSDGSKVNITSGIHVF